MSIDRADKPWIGDRRLTEVGVWRRRTEEPVVPTGQFEANSDGRHDHECHRRRRHAGPREPEHFLGLVAAVAAHQAAGNLNR